MANLYRINTLSDLFRVPIGRRAAMFRGLEYGMALHELAFGDRAAEAWAGATWVDDGLNDVTISRNGEPLLSLVVSDAAPPAPEGGVMAESYDAAAPEDRWIMNNGERIWMRGDNCPHCRHPIVTNGYDSWCSACEFEEAK